MRLRFLWIGKTKDPLYLELEERYLKRLGRFLPTERTWVPEERKTDPRQHHAQSEQEAVNIERKLPAGTQLVVLDAGGREFSSPQLAAFLEDLSKRGIGKLTFVVGGHAGVPERTMNAAHFRFSLSQLTLPHELARVLLLEQVYRAMTIVKGLAYHR